VSTILLLVIAIVAPWTVHLAPPRQRPLALVGVIAVFLLYGIFAENPLTQWEMWAGLAAGILTVMFLAGGANAGRGSRPRSTSRPRPPRSRPRPFEEGNEPTGEL
jgi:peptidoglycan/LPS O-acetylase OafA/YrhL